MKKLIIIIAQVFLVASIVQSSESTKSQMDNLIEELELIYIPKVEVLEHLYLKMDYGSPVILNIKELKKLEGAQIIGVDVVCTDDPSGIDLTNLTMDRIDNLKSLSPAMFNDDNINWRLIRQTGCDNKSTASELFHGVVIAYRPMATAESIEKEIEYIKSLTEEIYPVEAVSMHLYEVLEDGVDDFIWSKDLKEKPRRKSEIKKKVGERVTSLVDEAMVEGDFGSKSSISLNNKYADSTVMAVLNRNHWDDLLITSDLTGSMSPFVGQLFLWLRLNSTLDKVKHFVFFNDGNRTPDRLKVIGNTGGIYNTNSSKFKDIQNLAFKTMRAGYGGDGPENDLEALIEAIELCEDCENIVLIADNWAPIKDISLLSKITKPVKVVLCGTNYGINIQYLNLARATGGSVHTIEEDLMDLVALNDGSSLKIRGKKYTIVDGKFVKGKVIASSSSR